jgi:hypothetical protein
MNILLPDASGAMMPYTLRGPGAFETAKAPFNRIAYAAAHVVADPRAAINPWQQTAVDWDATMAYRQYLWRLGFGVAARVRRRDRKTQGEWQQHAAGGCARTCTSHGTRHRG